MDSRVDMTARFAPIKDMLRELPDKFIVKDVRAEIRDGAKQFMEEAKARCPVDTGLMRESIIMKSGYNKREGIVFGVVGIRKIGKRERLRIQQKKLERKLPGVAQEYSAYYAHFVEFGTEKMQAKPFMGPTFDEKSHPVLNSVTDGLTDRLSGELQKLKEKEIQ